MVPKRNPLYKKSTHALIFFRPVSHSTPLRWGRVPQRLSRDLPLPFKEKFLTRKKACPRTFSFRTSVVKKKKKKKLCKKKCSVTQLCEFFNIPTPLVVDRANASSRVKIAKMRHRQGGGVNDKPWILMQNVSI